MKHTIGLDIGIASVGWSVINLDKNRIEDLGVRIFPAPEHPKDGSSLAKQRREASGTRKRNQRKTARLQKIQALFREEKILTSLEIENLLNAHSEKSPYELRTDALSRELSAPEWFRALYHIAKHRGFQSNKKIKAGSKEKEKEEGALLEGVKTNALLMAEKGYRTVGEMFFLDPKFTDHKRNKGGDYAHTVSQELLREEVELLFAEQKRLGNPHTSEIFRKSFIEAFTSRLPFAAPGQIESKIGFCTFEKNEKRAPRMSWSAERFILLGKVNNLRILDTFKGERPLTPEERENLINLAYKKAEVKYKDIRKAFSLEESSYFSGIRYSKEDAREGSENGKFIALKGTHELRKEITERLGKEAWETYESTPAILDEIALTLTLLKTEEDIRSDLESKKIPSVLIDAVIDLDFKSTINLSFRALRKILPFMESGFRYDEACEKAGYPYENAERTKLLPPDDFDDITNPVVKRSLHQTRKVLNAIIRKYGSPWSIHIELAREMGKSFDDRKKIQKMQDENRNERERLKADFISNFHREPSGTDLLKYRLWKEQNCCDPYVQLPVGPGIFEPKYIDPIRLFQQGDGTYAEIDHIIPYSRSLDNSYTNKILVLAEENRNKGNKTPGEYLFSSTNPECWDAFVAWVQSNIRNGKKRRNLLRESFTLEDSREMTERNLTDTRYITRYLANYLESRLQFSDPSPSSKKVHRVNGGVTAALRGLWGLPKDREESHLHHALDAVVVAVTAPHLIERMTEYDRMRKAANFGTGQDRSSRNAPQPWAGFRKELLARISENPAEEIGKIALPSYKQEEIDSLRPIFVSHMPVRKATGAAHKETVRSLKLADTLGGTFVRTPLTKLKLADLENMVGKERDRKLYDALKERLSANDGKGEKAFGTSAPLFRKPTREGNPGPIVRSVKIFSPGTSGVRVRGGIADNDNLVRVDIYSYKNKFSLVPHYVDDIARGVLRRKGILAHKDENNWEPITPEHKFLFSLFPNDLVEVLQRNDDSVLGYYRTVDRDNGRLTLASHDGKEEDIRVSMRTCKSIRKFQVGLLGDFHEVKKEKLPSGKPVHELA
ncbi:CRISPR-associated Csn1 family endonuclease [Aminivibrio pyruvatiphilus]|uniref:CRISPR-associated endonuclease Cas9 n=1 Tax=Aminivibrio pyruvatiphilus TaxID=1005740 RepID=A0A4R8MGP6_9BACT|nr:type II CRISPR RNA-guided endonuclease Cas9 [Aminivibrio pyruvatiphilus]TDY63095.1 CRISPR-associated Csn1 family endonuclease [Aminivibrio pyruvatiphilus]